MAHWLRGPPDSQLSTPGNPSQRWLISEFVTLACPLAHADLLVAADEQDLHRHVRERVLVTCPPDRQQIATAAARPYRFRKPPLGERPGATLLHHAAPFAPVRWTNFYFAHDRVGGPLAPTLGPGIEDLRLGNSTSFADMLFHFPHSSYWKSDGSRFNAGGTQQTRSFLTDLVTRRGTVLISLPSGVRPGVLDQLECALRDHRGPDGPAESVPRLAVRLYLEERLAPDWDRLRRETWFPVVEITTPTAELLRTLRGIAVPAGGRVTVLVSPNVISGLLTRSRVTAEPGSDAEFMELSESEEQEPEAQPSMEQEFRSAGRHLRTRSSRIAPCARSLRLVGVQSG